MSHEYDVYILASRSRVLYVGVTSDLAKRVDEHRRHAVPGFAEKYNVTRLVFYQTFTDVRHAIEREKQLKGWRREKKVVLIESMNPGWRDLYQDWLDESAGKPVDVEVPQVATAPFGMTGDARPRQWNPSTDGPAMTLRNPLHPIRRRLG